MKKPMIKLALATAVAIGTGAALAQEFGDGAATESKPFVQSGNGAMAQDQELIAPEKLSTPMENVNPPPKAKPIDEINLMMSADGILPYDTNTMRIAVAAEVTFDIRNPKVSADFIEERSSRMMELMLNGKAEIIKTICSRMSAERILELPANPIRKQLEKQEAEIKDHIEVAKQLLTEAGIKLDEAKLNTKKLTIPELMAAIADVFKSDYAAKLDAEKKAEFEAAQNDYNKLKDEYNSLIIQAKSVQAQFNENLQEKSGVDISLTSEMQISGCTIMEQAEGSWFDVEAKTWKYSIAALFTWSMEHQNAAKAILAGEKITCIPNKGKHSLVEWLDHYADVKPEKGGLCDWMGPRTYIDDKGDLWYLGIYSSPVLPNARDNEKAKKAAALMARAEVGFALLSDVVTSNAYESLHLDVKVDGQTVSKKFSDYSEKTRESFKNLVIFGLGKVREYERIHASGRKINIVVCGVNATNAKSMKDIQRIAKKTALEINTQQQEELEHQRRIRQQIEASRDNPTARQHGADRADAETAEDFKVKSQNAGSNSNEASKAPVQQNGGLKNSTRFTRATDDF